MSKKYDQLFYKRNIMVKYFKRCLKNKQEMYNKRYFVIFIKLVKKIKNVSLIIISFGKDNE